MDATEFHITLPSTTSLEEFCPQYVQSLQSPFTATLETDRVGVVDRVDGHYVTRY